MLVMTDRAGAQLAQMLSDVDAADGLVVRIVFAFTGLELQISAECPRDTCFSFGGQKVLVLDPYLADALSSKTLDMKQVGGQLQLDLQ